MKPHDSSAQPAQRSGGILGFIERLGNKLPDPIFLFIGATVFIMVLSSVGALLGWEVQPKRPVVEMQTLVENGVEVRRAVHDESGKPVVKLVEAGSAITPRSLISIDGLYWLLSNVVRNFINFAPLGVVLVAMFGIGIGERVGMFQAFMKWAARLVAPSLLTPMVVFLGIMSHVASDAGYIVMPPLAAALYAAAGRPPLAGIAAAFAGVAGGFAANLLVASSDTLIAPITQLGARVLDPTYQVIPTCNWYFMAASAIMLTLVGWFVTARIVEPRQKAVGGYTLTVDADTQQLSAQEVRGLKFALLGFIPALILVLALIFVPGAPLNGPMPAPAPTYGPIPLAHGATEGTFAPPEGVQIGKDPLDGTATLKPGMTLDVATAEHDAGPAIRGSLRVTEAEQVDGRFTPAPQPQPRWSQAVVPLILVLFLVPGLCFGIATGAIRSTEDVSKAFIDNMRTMAPIIAMAFFAAQFVECFKFSRMDAMIANAGGSALFAADLPRPAMLVGLVVLCIVLDLLISSMSAKWTALSMILVPMMMMTGVSPELTQAAYRVGDSVANVVTPLNSYIIVILGVLQKYRKDAGIGDLIAMMVPYSVIFFFAWTAFLLIWVGAGIPLGPFGPLEYVPAAE